MPAAKSSKPDRAPRASIALFNGVAAEQHRRHALVLDGHQDIVSLRRREVRSFDPSRSNPAGGDFVAVLEGEIAKSHGLIQFDGYIVPKGKDKVTRLLFCREFDRERSYLDILGMGGVIDRQIEALALSQELVKLIDVDRVVEFSRMIHAPVDFVFAPAGYPRDRREAENPNIIVVTDVYGDALVRRMNVAELRAHLEINGKRKTSKGLAYACTALEFHLAYVDSEDSLVTAWPGDLDGLMMSPDTSEPVAILEYKSDTRGIPLEAESKGRYKVADCTRFGVLDSVCRMLSVPLVLVFWSVHHADAKITVRCAHTGEQSDTIIRADNRAHLAVKVADHLRATVGHEGAAQLRQARRALIEQARLERIREAQACAAEPVEAGSVWC